MAFVGGVALLAASGGGARAWGPMGHAIVARIAAAELTPAARAKVEALIGKPAGARMADVSSWPDWQGRARPETKPWHYVDIEIDSAGYVAARDCPTGDCIVAAIARQEATLRDHSATRDRRAEALVWLIHLLGDLHQPLHCADDHDRGGNEVPVWIDDRRSNLHALWDRAPNELAQAELGEDTASAALDRRITAAQRAAWRRGDPARWASESFRLARDRIYRPMLADRDGEPGAPDAQIVTIQLEKAGVRLARLLNGDLR